MTMGKPSVKGNNFSSMKTHVKGLGMVLGAGDLPVQPLSRERPRGKFTVGRGHDGAILPHPQHGLPGGGLVDYNASNLLDPLAIFPFDQGKNNGHTYPRDIHTHPPCS